MFLLFSSLKMMAIKTIKNGFKSSIGWNLGRKKRSIHLFEPFASTPKNGTRIKKNKNSRNKILETLVKSL